MYKQVSAIGSDIREPGMTATFVRGPWSLDAIAERDRREFEESLKAQMERLNRNVRGLDGLHLLQPA